MSVNYGHTTFSCILMDINASKDFPWDIVLLVGDRPWTQTLNYEGCPFFFFATRHLTLDCPSSHCKKGEVT